MIWCLGMFSSASTWTFKVVREIARSVSPDAEPLAVFLDFEDRLRDHNARIVKTHGTAIADELAARAASIIITIRDPRDAIVSLMRHNKLPFELALRMTEVSAWTCGRFMADRRTMLLRFENRFFEDPRTVGQLAAAVSGPLPTGESNRIFAALRRESVDAFIGGLEARPTTMRVVHAATGEPDAYDPVTGWHRHHAGRAGEVGQWGRFLSDVQVRMTERRLRVWMERVGYDAVSSRGAGYGLSVGRYEVVG